MKRQKNARLVMTLFLLLLPAAASAQVTGSSIAGVVRDTSGAVLPGVAVEAASPALIERIRTATTDGRGVYQIIDLRPGLYTVTFTLPGFSTLKRDGVELPAGFTAVNGECGAWSDLAFGQVRAVNSRNAPDSLEGFNRQSYNWQGSVTIQQELRRGMALNVGYFRTWYGGFQVTDNQSVTPADYDPFCITVPVDSRLPNSGQQLCGLYDLRPGLFGSVSNLVTQASHYGKRSQVYNGVDVALNVRFAQGGQFSGGLSVGRTVTDNCFVVDSPGLSTVNAANPQVRPGFCRIAPPWDAATQVKFLVVYPLPWGLRTSAVYQNVPGIPITASYVARNAELLPTLGRNLGSCRGAATCNGTVTIDLIPPNTLFEDRLQQVDLRFSRIFRLGRSKVTGNFDINNLLNASDVLNMNTRYNNQNNQWLNVRQILGGRLAKLSAQFDF